MSKKKHNRPLAKVNNKPIAWLVQEEQETTCKKCNKKTDTFVDMQIKASHKENAKQSYFCLDCADKMFDEAIKQLKLYKERGVRGVEFIDKV